MSGGLLHHVEIYVSSLRESKEFWGWFLGDLGYSEFQNWDSGVSYKLGSCYIVFVQVEKKYKDIPYHRCGVGLNHLAFFAKSKNQIDEITQKLKEKKIEILYKEKHPFAGGPDSYALFFEDPDRIKVELTLA
ncbi:VOC family protein [bacterium]|nr:VOC family protein [bacterium]